MTTELDIIARVALSALVAMIAAAFFSKGGGRAGFIAACAGLAAMLTIFLCAIAAIWSW